MTIIRRLFILSWFLILLAGCAPAPSNSNSTVSTQPSPSPSASPSPETTEAASVQITLPLLDALFTDDKFVARVKQNLKLTDQQIEELQSQLESERDGRKEDRFVGIICLVLLLDVVFFSVMPTFGGPLALLVLQLLVLIPLAKRMGMEEIAKILSRVLHRMAGRTSDGE